MDVSTSGMVAQRLRMDSIANNLANLSTTRDASGRPNPYVRERVIFQVGMPEAKSKLGVHVARVERDDPAVYPGAEPFRLRYEPGHPDANAQGYVQLPNVDPIREFVNSLEAARAYEANIQAFEVAKNMTVQTLQLL
jgi:flagellar basal-body rod protein FlgC